VKLEPARNAAQNRYSSHFTYFIGKIPEPSVQENKDRWRELCKQAEREQDPDKLVELTEEIDRLLSEKQNRLDGRSGER
jgi:hypothetical protein